VLADEAALTFSPARDVITTGTEASPAELTEAILRHTTLSEMMHENVLGMALDTLPDLIQALYCIREEQPRDSGMFRHLQKKLGRNDPCPCGSGKKYKKCCLN
jgi:uncharacterized protein YecA (UPF0149 family)